MQIQYYFLQGSCTSSDLGCCICMLEPCPADTKGWPFRKSLAHGVRPSTGDSGIDANIRGGRKWDTVLIFWSLSHFTVGWFPVNCSVSGTGLTPMHWISAAFLLQRWWPNHLQSWSEGQKFVLRATILDSLRRGWFEGSWGHEGFRLLQRVNKKLSKKKRLSNSPQAASATEIWL